MRLLLLFVKLRYLCCLLVRFATCDTQKLGSLCFDSVENSSKSFRWQVEGEVSRDPKKLVELLGPFIAFVFPVAPEIL